MANKPDIEKQIALGGTLHSIATGNTVAYTHEVGDYDWAAGLDGAEKSDAETKQYDINRWLRNKTSSLQSQVDQISSAYVPKGSVNSVAELLAKKPVKVGYVYSMNIECTINGKTYPPDTNFVCINTKTDGTVEADWDSIGGIGNLTDIYDKINQNSAAIQKETAERKSADTTLTNNLNKEITDRTNAVTKLTTDLNTEKQERQDADNNLAKIVYSNHLAQNIWASTTIIERDVATNVTVSWNTSLSGGPDSFGFKSYAVTKAGAAWASSAGATQTPLRSGSKQDNISTTTKYEITGQFDYGITKTSSVTINAYYPRYIVVGPRDSVDSAAILAGTKMPISGGAGGNWPLKSPSGGSSVFFCVPDGFNINKVTLSGFAFPISGPTTVAVNGKGNYKIYKSVNKVDAGSWTLVVS